MKQPVCRMLVALFTLVSLCSTSQAAQEDALVFEDQPLDEAIVLPDWFKLSFLDLNEDLEDARRGRRGLIIYFGRKDCPYCRAHLNNNWGQRDIISYTRENFDVIAIDVRGNRTVTGLDGKEYSEKEFSVIKKTNFTPSLLFFDKQGQLALKLQGYRPPYQFRAALEYVADAHHKTESFRKYLARAEAAMSYGHDTLNEYPAFASPPYNLDRSHVPANAPLLVVFEQRKCHACDVLHAGPLLDPAIMKLIRQFDAIQLDMWAETPVITPTGIKTTAKLWADTLELNHAPTLIFYDEAGKEIIRIDSVVGFYRLRNVLQYITSKGYKQYPTFQQWRNRKKK